MKCLRNILAGLSIFLCLSCSSDDDSNNVVDSINIQEVTNIATDGTWRITSYVENGNNMTNNFTGYNFSFNSNGTVTAVNGDATINGTWAISNDDDDDDNSPTDSDVEFDLDFNVDDDSDFDDLNDDWDILSYTNNKISLIDDDDDDDDDTEMLVFEKN